MPLIATSRGNIWIQDNRTDLNATASIIIHGAGKSHATFPQALAGLKSANAILPDLVGHGQSDQTGRNTMDDYAQDIIALMDALSIQKAIIMGHSLGGAIAQCLALDYPERVRGLCLLATAAKLEVNPLIIEGIVSKTDETIAMLIKWMWSKSASDEQRQPSIQLMKNTDPLVTQGDYIACNNFDVAHRLGEISAPTLVIAGANDRMIPLSQTQALADAIPSAQFQVIENSGHMMLNEEAQTVATLIDRWLQKIR